MQDMMGHNDELTLFGGGESWNASGWTASDDRVRGGKSQSYLDISGSSARFHGNLDIKTLGGAGFASQRTATDSTTWDLSSYDGIKLDLGKSDGKRYTFIMKDELLPPDPATGREQSTISYEYDFNVSTDASQAESSFVFIPWNDLKPTYRGKEKKDANPLNKKAIKRFSIMMRSFFGDQEGDFSLNIQSIKAISQPTDVEKGFKSERAISDGQTSASSMASSVISLLAACVVGYAMCTYMCTLVQRLRNAK